MRYLRVGFVQNAIALYGAQAATYLLPMITLPYLARVLGPQTWGLIALSQAVGVYVLLVVEYGFNLSATRAIARQRESPEMLADIVAGVLGAKIVLGIVCFVVAALVVLALPESGDTRLSVLLGVAWGAAMGLRPTWLFLGLERLRLVTVVDIVARSLGIVAIFVLVQSPAHGLRALEIYALTALVSALGATALAYRSVPFRLPRRSSTRAALRTGRDLFLFRVAISLYTTSNTIVLAVVAPVQAVGFYAGAEKIHRAFSGMMDPISQAIYPRASRLARQEQARAARDACLGVAAMAIGGALAALAIVVLAPELVSVALGPGYASSIPVLRVLALILPVLGISIPLVVQWMFPLGLERVVSRVSVGAGVLHLLLTTTLGMRSGALGVAWALVVTEVVVVVTLWTVLSRRGLNPFSARRGVLQPFPSGETG